MDVYDIMLDSTGDEVHSAGDLLADECTLQCQKLLLITANCAIKHEPIKVVDIGSFILDERSGEDLKADIQNCFEDDGMTFTKLKVPNLEDIEIVAEYGTQN